MPDPRPILTVLSPRQLELVTHLVKGRFRVEAAREMFITPQTVYPMLFRARANTASRTTEQLIARVAVALYRKAHARPFEDPALDPAETEPSQQ